MNLQEKLCLFCIMFKMQFRIKVWIKFWHIVGCIATSRLNIKTQGNYI